MKPIIQFNMNNKDRLMLLLSIIFLGFVIAIFIQATRVTADFNQESIDSVVIKNDSRQSISFILGEDKEQQNPFYENAATYFRNNPEAKTDEVVTNCRSLVALNRTLEKYYYINEKSFSLINIVVHSNPWSGISVPITDKGKRTRANELEEALKNQIIVALDNNIVDEKTRIVIHACGLGENIELTNALQKAIGGSDLIQPQIVVSNTYVNFTKDFDRIKKNELEAFYAYYPTAYKPADLHLARQLKHRYPAENIDWLKAIQTNNLNYSMEPFSYKYNIPIEWEVLYPEYDVPALNSELDKLQWLTNQDELMQLVEKTKIPFSQFRWIVKKGNKMTDEGLEIPSVKVFGKVTVLCILKSPENKLQKNVISQKV